MSERVPNEDEVQLVEALRGGERVTREAAFCRLFALYRRPVFALCHGLTGNRQDAEDATQEVFVGVLRGIRGFRGQARLKTWIYRIALRQALRMRDQRRRRDNATAALRQPPPLMRQAQPEFTAEELARALDCLSAAHRSVLVLAALEGMTSREIAEVLGIKEGTVWSRLHTARRQVEMLLRGE